MNMDVLWHATATIVTFFLIGWLGYHLAKKGWFTAESSAMLSRLLTRIVIPANLLYNIRNAMSRDEFMANAHGIILPVLSIAVSMLLAVLVVRWMKISREHRSIFITSFSCSNTINIGLPINLALFGESSIPAILVYYMGNTIMFWSIGNYLLASDSQAREPAPLLSRQTLDRIFSPSILAFLLGVVLLLADIPIPPVVGNAFKHVGVMTTGLATMCIGIGIWETGFANIRIDREILAICAGRFIISPLLLLGMLFLLPVPELTRKVFVIQSSLPPMTTIALLAMYYKTDAKFAAVVVSFGTLCTLITVPLYMVLLN